MKNRVFIIGSGPSLKGFNFNKIKKEKILCTNKTFIFVPHCDYLLTCDYILLQREGKTFLQDIKYNPVKKIFIAHTDVLEKKDEFYFDKRFKLYYDLINKLNFSVIESDSTRTVVGDTIETFASFGFSGFAAIQYAYLFFDEIILLGFDFYKTEGHFYDRVPMPSFRQKNHRGYFERKKKEFLSEENIQKLKKKKFYWTCGDEESLNKFAEKIEL